MPTINDLTELQQQIGNFNYKHHGNVIYIENPTVKQCTVLYTKFADYKTEFHNNIFIIHE